MNVADALAQTAFFRGLPREACERVAAVARVESRAKRDTLFFEQTRGQSIYFLLEGQVGLSKTTAEGSEIVVRTLKPGEVFAEVILFEQDRYPVTATALTAVKVLAFDRRDILRLLEHAPFRNAFIAMLMRKQRYLAERVHYLTSYEVADRFFLFLKEQYGEQTAFRVALSKKDIAAAIGAMPETFSRLLQRLKQRGVLKWQGETLRLKDGFWKKYHDAELDV
jgi:CRP-like cAMP-binding protein